MTDKQISGILSNLNLNKHKLPSTIILRPLSENVDYGFVWSGRKKGMPVTPSKFYFIKNEENIYVGAVIDHCQDLHWFISPKYRKKGFLTKSLKSTIIPHLLENKEEQIITISKGCAEFDNSRRVALNVGFAFNKFLDKSEIKSEFVISCIDIQNEYLKSPIRPISEDRLKHLKETLENIGLAMCKVEYELKAHYEDSGKLEELRQEFESFINYQFEDIHYKYNTITEN